MNAESGSDHSSDVPSQPSTIAQAAPTGQPQWLDFPRFGVALSPTALALAGIIAAGFLPGMQWQMSLILMAVLLVGLGAWALIFFLQRLRIKGIRIDAEGITYRRTLRWEDIAEIKWLALVGKNGRRFKLPAYPTIRKRVVSAAISHRPDAPVTPFARKKLDRPDTSRSGLVIGSLCLAAIGVATAASLLLVRNVDIWWTYLPLPFIYLFGELAFRRMPSNRADKWALESARMPKFFYLLFGGYTLMFIGVPLRAVDAVIVAMVVQCLIAAWVYWNRPLMRRKHEWLVALVMVVAACTAYFGIDDSIRPVAMPAPFPADTRSMNFAPPLMWNPDKTLAVNMYMSSDDDQPGAELTQYVIDFRAKKLTPLPAHSDFLSVRAFGSKAIVRTWHRYSTSERTLLVYLLDTGREVVLDHRTYCKSELLGPNSRCISPDGQKIGWVKLDWDQNKELSNLREAIEGASTSQAASASSPAAESQPSHGPPEAKVYDIATGKTQVLNVAWPNNPFIIWKESGWADDDTFVVVGNEENRDSQKYSEFKHILRVNVKTGQTEHWRSPEPIPSVYWNLSPDYTKAFLHNVNYSTVFYVDLATWAKTPLVGGELPTWRADGKRAFRVADFGADGQWLCRFDVVTSRETRLLEIPANMTLGSLSESGAYAVLVMRHLILYDVFIVDVATGQRKRLDVNVPTAVINFMPDCFSSFMSHHNFDGDWLPDESMLFVQESYSPMRFQAIPTGRLLAFPVPSEWLKEKQQKDR